ncbi:MAG: glycosyltransferase [Microscillaceae bacterium]|nr:glycosyltransferase [Microscillaceae bacterium]MDW8460590.1 glycosyltransferase family 2 protein [Cytophagales bacterium]
MTTHYPKISIITPSYNQGQYIEQTILSVIEQGYPNLEYIIIDGQSTDNSIAIIQKYEKYLSYWTSEKSLGQSDAINKGLQRATGEIINWLNSDDYYEPQTLFKVAQTFMNTQAKVVCGRSRIFKDNQTLYFSQGTDVYPNNLAKTIGWARIDQPETFFHHSAIEKMGLLDNRLHYLMDRDWWIKYLLHFGLNHIQKIPDLLVNFRLHENSKTVSKAKLFDKEHHDIFYAIAKQAKLKKYQYFIQNFFNINPYFELHNFPPIEPELAERILNYYVLLKANEFYVENDKATTQAFLNFVNIDLLEKEDRELYKILNFRNRYIPIFLLELGRRLFR